MRKSKSFTTLEKAKTYAKSFLRNLYGRGDSNIHLTDADKREWQAARAVLTLAGIQCGLETVARHYCDLAKVVGDSSLLTDVVRDYAARTGKNENPIKLDALRNCYLESLRKRERSKRHIDAERSHTGQFLSHAGEIMSNQITRELIQDFLDAKKNVDPRTKENLLNAVKSIIRFGKCQRYVPREWDEADHVVTPSVKPKPVKIYTAEQLRRLFVAAPVKFRRYWLSLRSQVFDPVSWRVSTGSTSDCWKRPRRTKL